MYQLKQNTALAGRGGVRRWSAHVGVHPQHFSPRVPSILYHYDSRRLRVAIACAPALQSVQAMDSAAREGR